MSRYDWSPGVRNTQTTYLSGPRWSGIPELVVNLGARSGCDIEIVSVTGWLTQTVVFRLTGNATETREFARLVKQVVV